MKNLQELETKTRKEHYRKRRTRYRKWTLLVGVVLVGLFFGIGAYAGIFTRDDDGSRATYPVAHVGDVHSPDEAQQPSRRRQRRRPRTARRHASLRTNQRRKSPRKHSRSSFSE